MQHGELTGKGNQVSKDAAVRLPGNAYDAEGADLGAPVQQLLVDLNVLEKDSDQGKVGALTGTPFSVQVITSGATAFGKGWSSIVGFLGGGGAIAAGIKGLGFSSGQPLVAAVFTASAGILAAAVAISIAVMVRADVSSRALATAAQYQARATITSALLASSHFNVPTASPPEPNYVVKTGDDRWYPVKGFRMTGNGVVADLSDGSTPIALKDVNGLIPTSSWPSS